jgi:LacI family transcriptional regulator
VGEQVPGSKFPGLRHVGVNLKALGEMAAEYFIERGFRNFGAIASDIIGLPLLFHSLCRGDGFAAALRQRKLTCDIFDYKKEYPHEGKPLPPVSDSAKTEHVHRWLMGLPKPVAVFCYDDYAGHCLCALCRRSGLRVPEEVAILSVDDDIFCDMTYPHLSSICVPAEQIGYEAAKTMDTMLRHKNNRVSHRPVLLPPIGVITRQSTDIMAIEDQWVVKAVSYIRRNAHGGVCVDEVANEVHLPRRTLERRFHNVLGRGLFAEIRRVQIEHVKMMLAQTNETLETLSPQCGFKDVTRMSKAFKQAVGTSPGMYRRQFRGQSQS